MAVLLLAVISCRNGELPFRDAWLSLETSSAATRSSDPESDGISDVNIIIFRSDGTLEESLWLNSSRLERTSTGCSCSLRMLGGVPFDIFVLANLGYPLGRLTREQVRGFRHHLSRADEYIGGVPMSGCLENVRCPGSGKLTVPMTRAVARVSVAIDRRRLDKDVSFTATGVSVGGCPRSVSMFAGSRAESGDDVFSQGFRKSGREVDNLNTGLSGGVSGTVDVWLPENLQGETFSGITSRRQRVFAESDPRRSICSYIELTGEYDSDSLYSLPGSHLTYRFYLGESLTDCTVQRNCHYTVTLVPEGLGLGGDSWRVDRGDMSVHWKGQPWFKFWPAKYIECRLGDKVRVWCDYYPPDTPFDIGIEELEFDHERGIYDYEIDPDGKGVTLTMTKKGTGILHPSAGPPIDDSVAIMVVCEP